MTKKELIEKLSELPYVIGVNTKEELALHRGRATYEYLFLIEIEVGNTSDNKDSVEFKAYNEVNYARVYEILKLDIYDKLMDLDIHYFL